MANSEREQIEIAPQRGDSRISVAIPVSSN